MSIVCKGIIRKISKLSKINLILFFILIFALPVTAFVTFIEFAGVEDMAGDPSHRSYSASVADFNGDGFVDVYVVNYLRENYLYRNNGDGTFTEVGQVAGVADSGKGVRSAWADYDLDGDMDLFVANNLGDSNRLYRNEGDGTFKDMTLNAGIRSLPYSCNVDADWADYDLDGYPDIFVVQNGHLIHDEGLSNILYHNNGDGTFSDVTISTGLDNYGSGLTASWADYNIDGYPDLYVTNFTNNSLSYPENLTNSLYRNNGDGTFTDVTLQSGAYDGLGGFEVAWGDYDNDNLPDIYVANLLDVLDSSENSLFKNMGDGTFTEVSESAGVRNTASTVGALWSDFDLDGYLDLFISYNANRENTQHILYHNNGDGTFTDVTVSAGIDPDVPGQWSISSDFNNDGYPDIFIPRVGYENVLYLNQGASESGVAFLPKKVMPVKLKQKRDVVQMDSLPDEAFGGVSGVTTIDSKTVLVQWETPPTTSLNEDTYYIYFSNESGGQDTSVPKATTDPGRASWMVEGLNPDTIYYVRVYRFSTSENTLMVNDSKMLVRTLPIAYELDLRPVFTYSCLMIDCHFQTETSDAQLGLELGESTDAEDLVNIPSVELPTMNRITPFDSDNSYLFHKISGTQLDVGGSGVTMPKDRVDPLREAEISAIKDWINMGAKQVALSVYCDKESYSAGEDIKCYLNVLGGEGESVDVYVTLTFPDGNMFFLTPDTVWDNLTEEVTPFLDGWIITNTGSNNIITLKPHELSSSGSYTLDAVLVPSGQSGSDSSLWFSNLSSFQFSDSSQTGTAPAPVINANGSEGTITINTGEPLTITISLSAGSYSGNTADWWFVAESSTGEWQYYNLAQGVFTSDLTVTYQGALFDLNSYEVLNTLSFAAGTYTFYFAVDLNMNGALDTSEGLLFYDSVNVNIQDN